MSLLPTTIVAQQLGMSSSILSYYTSQGRITSVKVGKTVLLDPEQAKKELEEPGFYRRKENGSKRWSKKRVPES